MVGALLEEGRSELFWLPDLSVVDEDIAVESFGLVLVGHDSIDGHNEFRLPFSYSLERDTHDDAVLGWQGPATIHPR